MSEIQEGYITVLETELIESRGRQSFGRLLQASAEREGRSLDSYPCCREPTEVEYANELVAVPPVLIVRIVSEWISGRPESRLCTVPVPVEFRFEKFGLKYRLSAAVCARGSAAREGHYYTVVRTDSGDWYVYDDARIKAIGRRDDIQEIVDTIYFCLFEQI
jgi:hypothetical protein